jgi:uncharacterized protein (DUF1800 family)
MGLAQQAADKAPPREAQRPEYSSGQIRGDERILHALNRFTFGPRAGDVEAVKQMGLENWFDQQLRPGSIEETDLDARLAQYPAMQLSTMELLHRFPSNATVRQASDGRIEIPQNGTLHAVYENQMYRYQVRKTAKEDNQAAPAANPAAGANQGTAQLNGNQNPGTNANPNIGANSGMDASANMDVSAGMAPGAMPAQTAPSQPRPALPAAGQPATTAPAAAQPGQMDAMTPAVSANQPSVDPALITSIIALPPQQRVGRLQAMEPQDFVSFMKSLKPIQRAALTNGMSPQLKEALGDLEAPEQTAAQELFAQRLTRDIYSNAQLQEVMTDFWLNHFNVFLRKNEQMPYYLVSYERDVIRPLALGKFEDLLEAVAHSPAMMIYLDNAESIGPDSLAAERVKMAETRRPDSQKKAPQGLNENYARELMELHTLGVNGGYTQADVTQVARVLTGWTVDRPQFGGGFQFNPNRHEPGTKKVMGSKIKDNGEMEGRELLHMLASRPAAAQFISRKLAIRFVSDDPPQALIDRMAKSYMASGGDIPTVMKTLFHSPEFWAASDYRAKVKTPLEFVVSAVRASNANLDNMMPLVNALRQMGMPLYGAVPPTGYKWDAADWVSTGALVDRMNFALSLAANRLPGISVEWAPELDLASLDSNDAPKQIIPTPESEEARLEPLLVAGGVSAATRTAALEQFQAQSAQNAMAAAPVMLPRRANRAPAPDAYEREDQLLAGLLLGSPEFQRR